MSNTRGGNNKNPTAYASNVIQIQFSTRARRRVMRELCCGVASDFPMLGNLQPRINLIQLVATHK
jgi:hypothetical protein